MPESIDEEVAENVVEAALLELSTVLPRKDFDVKKKAGEACPIITVDNSSIHDQLVDGNHTHKTCDTTIQFEENTYGSLEREQNSHGETSNWENIRSFFCGNELPRNVAAFFFLGLFNNITYVVNNAGAGDIVPGDYGLIYITSILPTLLIKLTGPYWFHYVPYNVRIIVSALCISLNFILVSYGKYTWLRLVGVALGSIQGGLGESTLLGSAALYTDPARCLGMWSSGTGFAGPGGYILTLYVMDYVPTWGRVIVGQGIVIAFLVSYFCLLNSPPHGWPTKLDRAEEKTGTMTVLERMQQVSKLWIFMVPLCLVYFAEYSIQAGSWTGYAFDPAQIDDASARDETYKYMNFLYQWGVFVSRSSTAFFILNKLSLWSMPVVQCLLLVFFSFNATLQFWNGWSLLVPAFITGLIGGLVYANAFTLISKEVQKEYVEFSLSAASVADSLGILIGDIASLFIQACIFQSLGLSDQADTTCPGS